MKKNLFAVLTCLLFVVAFSSCTKEDISDAESSSVAGQNETHTSSDSGDSGARDPHGKASLNVEIVPGQIETHSSIVNKGDTPKRNGQIIVGDNQNHTDSVDN